MYLSNSFSVNARAKGMSAFIYAFQVALMKVFPTVRQIRSIVSALPYCTGNVTPRHSSGSWRAKEEMKTTVGLGTGYH